MIEQDLTQSAGAPRVAKGKVYIGNGGAEYGVRGYVTAYDTEKGSHGVSLLFLEIQTLGLKILQWKWLPKHGKELTGGNLVVVELSGTP